MALGQEVMVTRRPPTHTNNLGDQSVKQQVNEERRCQNSWAMPGFACLHSAGSSMGPPLLSPGFSHHLRGPLQKRKLCCFPLLGHSRRMHQGDRSSCLHEPASHKNTSVPSKSEPVEEFVGPADVTGPTDQENDLSSCIVNRRGRK